MTASKPTVTDLFVYPIKACRGVRVESMAVTPLGPSADRRWMIVREDGKCLTQRQVPKLCLVQPALPEAAVLGQWDALPPDATLVVTAPGQGSELRVPLVPPAGQALTTVTVWEFTGAAADEGDAAAEWLSAYIGQAVRLVRYAGSVPAAPAAAADAPPRVRPTDADFAPGGEVAFADGFPLLVARAENLAAVNAAIEGGGVPMTRFRPNVVLAGGAAAWEDDTWRRVRVAPSCGDENGVELSYVKPCDRCKVPTIDQETAEEGREPLATLNSIRSGSVLGWNKQRRSWTHSVFFAWNAVPRAGGVLRVGDAVDVLERAPWD